jgi:hypothetical protein
MFDTVCVFAELTASIILSAIVTIIGAAGAYTIRALCSQRRKTRELSAASRSISNEQTAISLALSHLVNISTRIIQGQHRRPGSIRGASTARRARSSRTTSTPHPGKARPTPRFDYPDSPPMDRQSRGRKMGVSRSRHTSDETLELTDSYVMPPPLLDTSALPRPVNLMTPLKPRYGRGMDTTCTSCGYHVVPGAYTAVDNSATVLLRHACQCSPGNICETPV